MKTSLILFVLITTFLINPVQAELALSEDSQQVKYLQSPSESMLVSGQPTREQLTSLARDGIKLVINLRPKAEQDWDEKEFVESLGLNYVNLPVAGKADLNFANAEELKNLIDNAEGETLVHCASGNRVGALMALARYAEGYDAATSIAYGERWGLRGLKPVVQAKLAKD